jgi:putative membrane protein
MSLRSATTMLLTVGVVSTAQGQAPPQEASPTSAVTPHQHAATQSHWGERSAGGIKLDPATFVTQATQGGLTEVAVSKAVATRTQDPKVKQFAEQMVRDHSKANDELTRLARAKGMQVPTSLDAQHQASVQTLSRLEVTELDAAYGTQMKEDHARTVALFQAATKLSDSELAAFADRTLPTLQQHEHLAGDLPGAVHTTEGDDRTHSR